LKQLKRILITGGAGFVGSGLSIFLKKNHPEFEVYAFDNLKRRGSELNLTRLREAGVNFIHGDVRAKSDFEDLPVVDLLIDASAEPSVLAGIDSSPNYLIETNLYGTINCLNFAQKCKAKVIFVSTSRIYPISQLERISTIETETRFEIASDPGVEGCTKNGITEKFPIEGPRSLYGATKLSSELIIQEFDSFLNVNSIINRCGVITGPYQMGKVDQGVVVLWVAKHIFNKSLAYIGYGGTGKQVRDILHIEDLCRLIESQILNFELFQGSTYNVGGGRECSVSLSELTELSARINNCSIPINKIMENRAADIKLYITDNTKINSVLGWKPLWNPEMIIDDVSKWIIDNKVILEPILS
jgi:CDP-paratose 2-epimerase